MTDYDDEEPLARWEAAFLPDWEWEAFDKVEEDDEVYFGRVKSPNTYGRWEYGYFSREQLKQAGAYRTDLDPDDEEPLFPDGSRVEDIVGVFETELDALQYLESEDRGDP